MKILTLNTHSLIEENYEEKLLIFVEKILEEKPVVFALQEVNQSMDKKEILFDTYYQSKAILKEDNHSYRVHKLLKEMGLNYYYTYLPCHIGYGKYDEGLSLFSLVPFSEVYEVDLSFAKEYDDFRTRKALIGKVHYANSKYIFASIHMGWWNKDHEKFAYQWDNLVQFIEKIKEQDEIVILMGDFNNASHIKNEGYDYILQSSYHDLYLGAENKDDGFTSNTKIDGWQKEKNIPIRIDYIFSNKKLDVKNHFVVFNGKNAKCVSDHFGIIAEIKRS